MKAIIFTMVWLMYGWGDNAFMSSVGIDQIAAKARHIPGVHAVYVRNYWETQRIANEIMAAPSGEKIVIGGYSCGANSPTSIAYGLYGHRNVYLVGIQESIWCGGYPLYGNVKAAQETYAGCVITLGFGCKRYTAAPGQRVPIRLIRRPDLHPWADTDPRTQRDVLNFIAGVTRLP